MAELLVDFEALSVCDKNVGKERILQQLVESETKEFLDGLLQYIYIMIAGARFFGISWSP